MALYKPTGGYGPVCDPLIAQGATARIVCKWPYAGDGECNNSGTVVSGKYAGTAIVDLACFADSGDFVGQSGGPTAIVLYATCNPANAPCSATLQLYNIQPPGACFRPGETIYNYTNGACSEVCESNCTPIPAVKESAKLKEVTDPFLFASKDDLAKIQSLYPDVGQRIIGYDGDGDPVYAQQPKTEIPQDFLNFWANLPSTDIDVYGGQGTQALPCGFNLAWDKPGEYYWTVPESVNSIKIITIGAGGGGGGDDASTNEVWGGAGSSIVSTLKTTPGEVLKLIVGGGGGAGAGCVAKAQGGDPGWCAGSGGEGQLVTYTPDGIAGSLLPNQAFVSNVGLYSTEKGIGAGSQATGTKELGGFDTTNVGGGKYVSFGLFEDKRPQGTSRVFRFSLDTRNAFKLRFKVIVGNDKNGGERVNSVGEGLHLWYNPGSGYKYAGLIAPSRGDCESGPSMANFGPGDPLWRTSDSAWDSAVDDWLNRDIALPKDAIGDNIMFELRQGKGSYQDGDLTAAEFYAAPQLAAQNKNANDRIGFRSVTLIGARTIGNGALGGWGGVGSGGLNNYTQNTLSAGSTDVGGSGGKKGNFGCSGGGGGGGGSTQVWNESGSTLYISAAGGGGGGGRGNHNFNPPNNLNYGMFGKSTANWRNRGLITGTSIDLRATVPGVSGTTNYVDGGGGGGGGGGYGLNGFSTTFGLYVAGTNGAWSSFMNQYGVWVNPAFDNLRGRDLSVLVGYMYFDTSGNYTLECQGDPVDGGTGYVFSIENSSGSKLLSTPAVTSYTATQTFTCNIPTPGFYGVRISFKNGSSSSSNWSSNPGGFAYVVKTPGGATLVTSRDAQGWGGVQGDVNLGFSETNYSKQYFDSTASGGSCGYSFINTNYVSNHTHTQKEARDGYKYIGLLRGSGGKMGTMGGSGFIQIIFGGG